MSEFVAFVAPEYVPPSLSGDAFTCGERDSLLLSVKRGMSQARVASESLWPVAKAELENDLHPRPVPPDQPVRRQPAADAWRFPTIRLPPSATPVLNAR